MKKILLTLLILAGLFLIILLFQSEIYRITPKAQLTNEQENILYNLAQQAKANGDLPISAIILYNKTIIGKGYNTVLKDSNAVGHAEINALNDAIKNFGMIEFMKMNSDSLTLISTLEPCQMCKGAISNYNIKYVHFIKEKPISNSVSTRFKDFRYQLNKKQISSPELLDSLSKLHTDY